MSKIEILAPVGNEEMLRAAVFSGADAVYLGFSGFNARTSANNFNADTLKDAVAFCHARGVAVHVALNTTVYGGELPALEQAIRAVAASGADAVICQDLAVATLIGKIAPLACYQVGTNDYAQWGQSVVLLIIDGSVGCTGTLINNTDNDGTPYLLTASHCLNKQFTMKNPDYEKIAGSIVCFFNFNSIFYNDIYCLFISNIFGNLLSSCITQSFFHFV